MTGRSDRASRTPVPTMDRRTQPLLPDAWTVASLHRWLDQVTALTPMTMLRHDLDQSDVLHGGRWDWHAAAAHFDRTWRYGIDQPVPQLDPVFRPQPAAPADWAAAFRSALADAAASPWPGGPLVIVTTGSARWWQVHHDSSTVVTIWRAPY